MYDYCSLRDNEALAGSVGVVIGFDDKRVRAKFPNPKKTRGCEIALSLLAGDISWTEEEQDEEMKVRRR